MYQLKKHKTLIKTLTRVPAKSVTGVVKHLDRKDIQSLSDIIVNTANGTIPLSKQHRRRLIPYKQRIRDIVHVCEKGKLQPIRRVLSKQTGGFLPLLLTPLLALIGKSLLGGALASGSGLLINKLANG